MRECRRAVALDELPAFPGQPKRAPCLHFVAAWGLAPDRAPLAEEMLWALAGNRELVIRNLRPADLEPRAIEALRPQLEAAARRFAHAAEADGDAGWGALFGDPHERDAVAREFARLMLGVPAETAAVPGGAR